MGLDVTKPVFGVKKRIIKAPISLHGCAGWSALCCSQAPEDRFSCVEAHMRKPDFVVGKQQRCSPACPSHSLFSIFVIHFLKNIILNLQNTIKPVLSGHSKRPKIGFQDRLSLNTMNWFKSIVECSKRAFCNTFDLH